MQLLAMEDGPRLSSATLRAALRPGHDSFYCVDRYSPTHPPDASSFNRITASARRVSTARWLM